VGVGKPQGALQPLAPVELTALVLQEVVRRAGVDPARIDDVVWGCVTPVGDQGANLARLGCSWQVSRQGSRGDSQPHVRLQPQAVHFAAQAILAGEMTW